MDASMVVWLLYPCLSDTSAQARIGNHLVVFGGANAQTQLADVFAFDLSGRRWSKVSPVDGQPPEPRAGHACVLHGGRREGEEARTGARMVRLGEEDRENRRGKEGSPWDAV
eukprot:753771-Hanusia_phi.AAC.4